MKDFKTFVNENLLVPRNLEGRKEKLKQMNIKLLPQEVVDGDLILDESFMDIDAKFVKLKKVNDCVILTGGLWTEIPEWLKNVEVLGYFSCAGNKLTTMKNCPAVIHGNINCADNKLITLEGSPEIINGNFHCSSNMLTSLKGCPKIINGSFSCSYNKLTSLEGCPETINGNLYCITKPTLELPDYVKLKGEFVNK